jgi:hypothetical protein
VTIVSNQIPLEDSLLGDPLDDILDRGFISLDRQPASHRRTTAEETRQGETLDERLVQEEPEPAPEPDPDPDEQWEVDLTDGERIGRLLATEEGVEDVGIDGGAASAEEAAMHLVREDRY